MTTSTTTDTVTVTDLTGRPTTDAEQIAGHSGEVGIHPVPSHHRRLKAFDLAVLWGDLSVGVLVLAAGALMVAPPEAYGLGMDFRTAFLAIVVGSIGGSLLMGLVGAVTHNSAVPTMVVLRSVLGTRGSYVASVLNVAQLIGWASFELWAMATFASRVSDHVFGVPAFGVWLLIMAGICTTFAILGPVQTVHAWLKKFGMWIVLAGCGSLTIYLLTRHGLGSALNARHGGAPFVVGVDLVIAQPISWLPLIADYNRYAISKRANFTGTFTGYTLGNIWFYALGALLVLMAGLADGSPEGIALSILGITGGGILGVALLASFVAGETDEAFANIYSASVSTQNVLPSLPRNVIAVAIATVSTIIAAVVTLGSYENFLFLLGSIFVPLFAIVLGQALAMRSDIGTTPATPAWRPSMMLVWIVGFLTYQWAVAPGILPSWSTSLVSNILPGTGTHTSYGASLPSFAIAFALAYAWQRFSKTTTHSA